MQRRTSEHIRTERETVHINWDEQKKIQIQSLEKGQPKKIGKMRNLGNYLWKGKLTLYTGIVLIKIKKKNIKRGIQKI